MALILNIDTATPAGSVCLSKDGKTIEERFNMEQKEHASVIAPFIREVMQSANVKGGQIDAIAISGGPGSYTGLRVATSTAKGLCYAWDIPLIAISTLKMMAGGMKEICVASGLKNAFLCPVIDARRMEVFTALYNLDLEAQIAPQAALIDETFLEVYKEAKVVVFGTGAPKTKKVLGNRNTWMFKPFTCKASQLTALAEAAYRQKRFEDPAYFDPFYLKSVYLPKKKGASFK